MSSILTNNPLPTSGTENNNPVSAVNSIIGQIMGSANPQAMFQQILQQSPDAKNAMSLINQYGNGNPKQAFMAYATATGRNELAKQILSKLGLS